MNSSQCSAIFGTHFFSLLLEAASKRYEEELANKMHEKKYMVQFSNFGVILPVNSNYLRRKSKTIDCLGEIKS